MNAKKVITTSIGKGCERPTGRAMLSLKRLKTLRLPADVEIFIGRRKVWPLSGTKK